MAFIFLASAIKPRTTFARSPGLSGSAATAKPCFAPSETTFVSLGATATIGLPAARIPYILLGTTTPFRPRFNRNDVRIGGGQDRGGSLRGRKLTTPHA